MRSFAAAIIIVLVGAVVTNPTKPQYLDWLQRQNAGAASAFMMIIARPLVDASTTAENHTAFTIFTTSIDGAHVSRVLGVAGQFLEMPPQTTASWVPGARSPNYPHVISARAQGQWLPEAGYNWINTPPPQGDLRVRWSPGSTSTSFPHVIAAVPEGRWLPEDGYVWINQSPIPGDLRVRWSPGSLSAAHEHVVAGPQERRWLSASGYKWVNNPRAPGDFRAELIGEAAEAPLPRFRGVALRRCTGSDHFQPETPCWFDGGHGMYVASKLGNMRSTTFQHWPNVDDELAYLDRVTANQARAGCSFSSGKLLCPSPGTGMCWAKGHNPYRDETPESIDVGNHGSPDYARTELCSNMTIQLLTSEQALLFDRR